MMQPEHIKRINQIIKLLQFLETLDDIEIIKNVLESVNETLTEIVNQENNIYSNGNKE